MTKRAVLVRKIADAPELRERSVHRKNPVGGDHPHACVRRIFEALLEFIQIIVRVAQPPRLAEADAVDDARVIERIADDRILFVEQSFEQSAIRVETRRIQNRILRRQERAEPLFELAMHDLRAADETNRRDAVAVLVERPMRRIHDGRVVGESQVIVRAQIDQFAAVGQADHGALRGSDDALALQQAGALQGGCVPAQAFAKLSDHTESF